MADIHSVLRDAGVLTARKMEVDQYGNPWIPDDPTIAFEPALDAITRTIRKDFRDALCCACIQMQEKCEDGSLRTDVDGRPVYDREIGYVSTRYGEPPQRLQLPPGARTLYELWSSCALPVPAPQENDNVFLEWRRAHPDHTIVFAPYIVKKTARMSELVAALKALNEGRRPARPGRNQKALLKEIEEESKNILCTRAEVFTSVRPTEFLWKEQGYFEGALIIGFPDWRTAPRDMDFAEPLSVQFQISWGYPALTRQLEKALWEQKVLEERQQELVEIEKRFEAVVEQARVIIDGRDALMSVARAADEFVQDVDPLSFKVSGWLYANERVSREIFDRMKELLPHEVSQHMGRSVTDRQNTLMQLCGIVKSAQRLRDAGSRLKDDRSKHLLGHIETIFSGAAKSLGDSDHEVAFQYAKAMDWGGLPFAHFETQARKALVPPGRSGGDVASKGNSSRLLFAQALVSLHEAFFIPDVRHELEISEIRFDADLNLCIQFIDRLDAKFPDAILARLSDGHRPGHRTSKWFARIIRGFVGTESGTKFQDFLNKSMTFNGNQIILKTEHHIKTFK